MFHNLTEFIIEIPKPARINGMALFNDELKLLILPTESFSMSEKTLIGFWSCINRITEPIEIAIINPIKKE